jgi:hypothetical protein
MKRILGSLVVALALGSLAVAHAEMKPGKCTFAKPAQVKKHATEHVTYPAKGAAIKQACKKELPDEFTKDEWACIDASLKDDQEYKSAGEVLKAVGAQ